MIADAALQDAVAALSNVVGCIGACVLDRQGNVLAHRLPPPYEAVLLSGAMGQLGIAIEMYTSIEAQPAPRVFVGRFEDGVLVARWIGGYVVLALGTRTLNTAMLMVAINAMSMKLSTQPGTRPVLSSPMVQSEPPNRPTGSLPALSVVPSTPARSSAPVQILPLETLREIVADLARSLGPLAQTVLKREVEKLGCETRSFPKDRAASLIDACGQQISDSSSRAAFVSAARKRVV